MPLAASDGLTRLALTTRSADETRSLGKLLGSLLRAGDWLALTGPVGSGKTCLAQGILAGLGVRDRVTSPTFMLVHHHRGRLPVWHVDAYRLASADEAEEIGLGEFVDGPGVVVLEWADRVAKWLPEHLEVDIAFDPGACDQHRHLRFLARGDRYRTLLAEFREAWRPRL